jgi:hypothetical protein
MKDSIKALVAYLTGPAFSFLLHWGATALVALGLHLGFHVSVPVIPTTVTVFAAQAFIRVALTNLAKAWHSGRLVAEVEAGAVTFGKDALADLIAAVEGKTSTKRA